MRTAVPHARPNSARVHDDGVQWSAPEPDPFRADPFRAAMRHHAKGVAVITAGTDDPIGFCATSVASVSLEPPLVSFTVGLRSSSWATIETARHVMVHLLSDSQAGLAALFARKDAAKFGPGTRWHRNELGLPVLDGVLAWLQLAVASRSTVGDHALVIGQVTASRHVAAGTARPLVHLGGEYVTLAPPAKATEATEAAEAGMIA
jgi:flavin reductase (DIM6/NTAB) family NADH-FMN oxidoreductase RutF